MRTTLTLDPDIARLLQAEAHRLRQPFKQVVNEALRRGLSARSDSKRVKYRVQPHCAKLLPGIDPARLNGLVDEMEDQAALRKRKRRRAS